MSNLWNIEDDKSLNFIRHKGVIKLPGKTAETTRFATKLQERKETNENEGQMGCIFTSAMAMYNIHTAVNGLIQVINSDPDSFMDESNKFGDVNAGADPRDDRDQRPD